MGNAGNHAFYEAVLNGAGREAAIDAAAAAQSAAQSANLARFGSMEAYITAHAENAVPIAEKSMASLTTNSATAGYFAGPNGIVIRTTLPRSAVVAQTLPGATEAEHLLTDMAKITFQRISP